MLPTEEEVELDLGPEEAAEELLARMLEYRRYRDAGAELAERFEAERPYLYRSAPLPLELRRVSLEAARPVYDPELLGRGAGRACCARRRSSTPRTSARPSRSSAASTCCATCSASSSRLDFDEAFGGEDRLTQAVTIFALLEMHKKGEATWSQRDNFGPIEIVAGDVPPRSAPAGGERVSSAADLARTIEALLFLSPGAGLGRRPDRGLRGRARSRSATRSTCSPRSSRPAAAGSS